MLKKAKASRGAGLEAPRGAGATREHANLMCLGKPTWQAIDATEHLLVVKFGRVHWYPFKKTDDKFVGYQNCGVKAHREAQAEYGRYYLRQQEDAVAEDTVYSCRCKYLPGTNPDTCMAKPALWRVDELVLKGRLR